MELISAHVHADFDALASMVAASKLYPKASLLFPGSQERNVREFLRETRFPLQAERLKGFPHHEVTRLILVDVKRITRIGPLREIVGRPGLEIHIYDHHPAHPKDIAGSLEVLREVGATTTILLAASGFSVGTPNRLWSVRMPWVSQPRGAGRDRGRRSGSRSPSCSARGSGTHRPSA